jgi:hypothetical protein
MPPPGWYPYDQGVVRWWDGMQWAGPGVPPLPLPALPPGGAPAFPYYSAPARPWYRRVWIWLLPLVGAAIVAIALWGHHINNVPHTVAYRITGDGGTATVIQTYVDSYGHTSSMMVPNASLPWSSTITVTGDNSTYQVTATQASGTTISCTITVDHRIAAEQTASGSTARVHCDGTP